MNQRRWWNIGRWALPAAVGLVAVILLLDRAQAFFQNDLTSDHLYIKSLYNDLFVDHYPLRGWTLPAAPYLVPDIPVAFAAFALSMDVFQGLALYACFLLAAFSAVTACAVRSVGGTRYLAAAGAAAMAFYLVAIQRHGFDFTFFQPGWHSGEVLAGLIMAVWFARSVVAGWTGRGLCAFLVLGGLAAASDRLIVAHALLPLACASVVLGLRTRRWTRGVTTGIAVSIAMTVLALGLPHILGELGVVMQNAPNDLGFWPDLAWHFVNFVWENDYTVLFGVAAIGLVSAVLGTFFAPTRPLAATAIETNRATEAYCLLQAFCLFSIAATMVLPFVAGTWGNIARLRYMFPAYVTPMLALVLTSARASLSRGNNSAQADTLLRGAQQALVPALLVFCIGGLPALEHGLEPGAVRPSYSADYECLDKAAEAWNLSWGFGEYFVAKLLTELSRSRVRVLTLFHTGYESSLQPPKFADRRQFIGWIYQFGWPNNMYWYLHAPIPSKDRGYFVLTKGLPAASVERLGMPDEVVRCGSLGDVALYSRADMTKGDMPLIRKGPGG